jgi:SAM-dependent methyltransferase
MLPSLVGRRVLDLGCGYGWFCRWAREHGAAAVLGVDVSQRMLAQAKASTSDAAISYVHSDLRQFDYPVAGFDVVYSSLAFHYLDDLAHVLSAVRRALAPAGVLVCSVEHPLFTAPKQPGWITHPGGHRSWPVDAYFDEGPRRTDWLAEGVIKHHRTIDSYLRLLREAGFALTHFHEWAPTAEQVAEHPEWADERQRPAFLLMAGACDAVQLRARSC